MHMVVGLLTLIVIYYMAANSKYENQKAEDKFLSEHGYNKEWQSQKHKELMEMIKNDCANGTHDFDDLVSVEFNGGRPHPIIGGTTYDLVDRVVERMMENRGMKFYDSMRTYWDDPEFRAFVDERDKRWRMNM